MAKERHKLRLAALRALAQVRNERIASLYYFDVCRVLWVCAVVVVVSPAGYARVFSCIICVHCVHDLCVL